jgi:hypothetical protein
MPRVQAAASSRSHLVDHLERLKAHAVKTGPTRLMFESVERLRGARNERSPTRLRAEHRRRRPRLLGTGGLSSEEFDREGDAAEHQRRVRVDSTSADRGRVSDTHVTSSPRPHDVVRLT